ncbi:hypothetical protein PV415_33120 [Streptomyces sp. ME03-5684b]|nr:MULTISPECIES: hypothetical protein [Streptomyces]MDX3321754.1 hypothetical protein [Streptomyces sp. ME03-5684b]WTC06398.1 hypothetical protein OHA15_00665 [Streptomyces anthocyanicus]WTC53261.1 hypothetical protein OG855_38275 [Streptomyces anthocyanicus]
MGSDDQVRATAAPPAFRQETLMHEVATGQALGTRVRRHDDGIGDRRGQDSVIRQVPLTWRDLGLDTMASLLVESFTQLGKRCFAARCQWPRLHPLNERAVGAVAHHPLIMAESTRQLAVALEYGRPSGAVRARLEPVSVGLGLRLRSWPVERRSATDVDVRMSVSDLVTKAGRPVAHRVTAEFLRTGEPFGSCSMRLLRPAGSAAPSGEVPLPGLLHPPAAAVGAAADGDVMLARGPRGRLVTAPRDPGHPVFLAGRPARMPLLAILEAGRQAVLLDSGMTAAAVIGLRAEVCAPAPSRGARVETSKEPGGSRFLVTAAGRLAATGAVTLWSR